jgi:hypothetical protein
MTRIQRLTGLKTTRIAYKKGLKSKHLLTTRITYKKGLKSMSYYRNPLNVILDLVNSQFPINSPRFLILFIL